MTRKSPRRKLRAFCLSDQPVRAFHVSQPYPARGKGQRKREQLAALNNSGRQTADNRKQTTGNEQREREQLAAHNKLQTVDNEQQTADNE